MRDSPDSRYLFEIMDTFEELGLRSELVEALAAEGIERPTEFQESAIPVIRRGNNLVGHAGPGAGTLVAYGTGLLDRIEAEGSALRVVVLVPSQERAHRLAQSLARLATSTGHTVAALGGNWALPTMAHLLFSTPHDLMEAVRGSEISLDDTEAIVVDGFGPIEGVEGLGNIETTFEIVPKEAQRILLSLPFPESTQAFEGAHLHKAVHLPPRAADDSAAAPSPQRGEVRYRVSSEAKEEEILHGVSGALDGDARHVLIFFASEDRAADTGDFLTLHGFPAGVPGDADAPVWLAVGELEARAAMGEVEKPDSVVTFSFDVPADQDSLDRRHSIGNGGTVLVLARELPHLKDVAKRTGYRLIPAEEPLPTRMVGELDRLRNTVERAMEEEDLAPYLLVLEPLFERSTPAEVAAAVFALLRRKETAKGGDAAAPHEPEKGPGRPSGRPETPTWVRLFISVGSRDDVGPGDLLGAVTGESGIEGSRVGKIDIRDTFSIVEVEEAVGQTVIRGLNGKTLKGRSIRADYDRGAKRGGGGSRRSGPPDRGPRG
ncbi:DbpA RNA binding domain-containing protein [Gemmatimonadota bacterium]